MLTEKEKATLEIVIRLWSYRAAKQDGISFDEVPEILQGIIDKDFTRRRSRYPNYFKLISNYRVRHAATMWRNKKQKQ